ncbi:MAG TPA: serine hydrolase [Chitinophagaceae bacterium]|jgi:CubicO group peptidase (beta-lactamase class C family)|nr:serine hydrolase [Chitinophagaceae bacterium]
MKTLTSALFIASVILASCSQPATKAVTVNEDNIPVSSMENEGIDSAMIHKLAADIQKGIYPNIHSLLIARNGKLVFENYWAGVQFIEPDPPVVQFTKDILHDLRSISKSVVSACVGIAIAQGKIKSVDQKVFDFFPEYAKQDTGLKSALTIKSLLTMTSGLLWNEDASYTSSENTETQMDFSGDPVAFVFNRPMQHPVGTIWNYNGGATQLLGSIIEKATGKKLDQFVNEYLFQPLGIEKFEWRKYSGTLLSAAPWGLRLRPRDMLKFGLVYANKGKWNNKQVIPASWVEESFQTHIKRDSAGGGYGYQFWTWSGNVLDKTVELVAAVGNGDQNIFIDRKNNLLVVTTAGNYNRSVERDCNNMLGDYIYPSLIKNN